MIKELENRTEEELSGALDVLQALRERIEGYIDNLEPPVMHDDSWPVKEQAYLELAGELLRDYRRWETMIQNQLTQGENSDGHPHTSDNTELASRDS